MSRKAIDSHSFLLIRVGISGLWTKIFLTPTQVKFLGDIWIWSCLLYFTPCIVIFDVLTFQVPVYLLSSIVCLYHSFLSKHTVSVSQFKRCAQSLMYVSLIVGVNISASYVMFWLLQFTSMGQVFDFDSYSYTFITLSICLIQFFDIGHAALVIVFRLKILQWGFREVQINQWKEAFSNVWFRIFYYTVDCTRWCFLAGSFVFMASLCLIPCMWDFICSCFCLGSIWYMPSA